MGNSPLESKANAPNLRCNECHNRLRNMEDFEDEEQQMTYRGWSHVFFEGLYYRLAGMDGKYWDDIKQDRIRLEGGWHVSFASIINSIHSLNGQDRIYYCHDCFFEPQRKAAEERHRKEERRLNELHKLEERRKKEMERKRRQEAADRYHREEERRRKEQEMRLHREQEERFRREQEKRRRREQEELKARERIEAQSRDLLERVNRFQREQYLHSDRKSEEVFVLQRVEGKVRPIDEEVLKEDQMGVPSHNVTNEFNKYLKGKEMRQIETESDESYDTYEIDEYDEYDESVLTSSPSDEMLKEKRNFLRSITDENEQTLYYMMTIIQLAKYSDKDSEEIINEVLWKHRTLQDLELILDIVCGLWSYSRETSALPHLCWVQQFLEELSKRNSSIFRTAHMKWIEQQWWANQREVETVFRYLHDTERGNSWPPHQILRLSTISQVTTSQEALACLKLISQFAIPSHTSIESQLLLDFLQKNLPSSPQRVIKALQKHYLDEKDMDLDQLLAIIDAPEAEKREYKESVKTVLEEITRYGYPGQVECSDKPKRVILPQKSQYDPLSLAAIATFNEFHYWPRVSQLLSCVVMLRKEEESGRLLQIQTGEGKSTIIAMVAAVMAMKEIKVDVITSSPVLATRDSKEWENFYAALNIKVAENITCQDDDKKKQVYCADVVYGTVSSFSGDILRNDFLSKDIRPQRKYEMVIVDEVDSMLVDNGVQFNYLCHNLASSGLRHLEPLLALIWKAVSDHAPVITETEEVLFRGNPEPFHMILYNLADDSDNDESWSPAKLIQLAHERLQIFTEDDIENWQHFSVESVIEKVENVSDDDVTSFFNIAKDEFGIPFQVYRLNESGVAEAVEIQSETDEEIPVLVLGSGRACRLNRKEILHNGIEQFVLHKIPKNGARVSDNQIKIPSFLRDFAKRKVNVFVESAFVALGMKDGREYTVKNGDILPIDFKSTGVIEQNKKWGDGLQQFLEMKHRLRISALGLVTNFMSNLFFFQKYKTNILGVSGTLGTNADKEFMQTYYKLKKFYTMPPNKMKKLLESPGILLNDESEWKNSLMDTIADVIASRRAVLVICEDITTVEIIKDEIASTEKLRGKTPIIYAESDNEDQMNRIKEEVSEGSIVIATNLAGRGTDIKVSDTVIENGGLFVLLTFLPSNRRVELQASGRAGRKGQPGSSHVILNRNQLPMYLRACTEIEDARFLRDEMEYTRIKAMEDNIAVVLKKEMLFGKYCKLIKSNINKKLNEGYQHRILNSLHETWALWLDENSDQLKDLDKSVLCSSLKTHMKPALQLLQEENLNKSPNENVYHILLHGAAMVNVGDDIAKNAAITAFQTSVDMEAFASSIAHYNMAFSLIELDGEKNLELATIHLESSQENLMHYKENISIIKELVDHSYTCELATNEQIGFKSYIDTRIQFLQFWEKKILEAIEKVKEISAKGKEAKVLPNGIFSLVNDPDEFMDDTLNEFYQMGLLLIFTVKEKPKFSWSALAAFFIGLLEVAAGAILIAVTAGTATNVGMGLISEGISDVFDGAKGMIEGTFDWASWGISKAISFGTSLLVGGVGKFLKGGVSAVKGTVKQGISGLKNVFKGAKTVCKQELKGGMSAAMKGTLKNTGKKIGKQAVEKGIMYGVQKGEDWLLKEVLGLIMKKVKPTLLKQLKEDVKREPLRTSLLALLPEERGAVSSSDVDSRVEAVTQLAKGVVQPYYEQISWKKDVNSAIQQTLEKVKGEDKAGKYGAMLSIFKTAYTISEITDTMAQLSLLCKKFTEDLRKAADKKRCDDGKRQRAHNRDGTSEQELTFLDDVACHLSEVFGDVIFSIVHEGAASHLAKLAKSKINSHLKEFTKKTLNTTHTEQKINLANSAFQISHGTGKTANYNGAGLVDAKTIVKTHAYNIVKETTKGGLLECKVLADHLLKTILIYSEGKDGEIIQHRQVSPHSTSAASELPIKLLYHRPSSKFPDGHYEALDGKNAVIQTKTASKGASCLFEAVHLNLNPASLINGEQITNGAEELRSKVALKIQSHPRRYAEHVEKYEFNKRLGELSQEYMGIGGAKKMESRAKQSKERKDTNGKNKTETSRTRKFTEGKEFQKGKVMHFPVGGNIVEQTQNHVHDRFVHFYEVLRKVAELCAKGVSIKVGPASTQAAKGVYSGEDVSTFADIDEMFRLTGKTLDDQCRDGHIKLDASHTTAFYPNIEGLDAGGETKNYIDDLTSRTYLSPKPINIGQGRDIDIWQVQIATNVLSSPENSRKFLGCYDENPVETFKAHLNESIAYGDKTHQTLEARLKERVENSQGSSEMISNVILATIDNGKTSSDLRNRLNNVRPYETTP